MRWLTGVWRPSVQKSDFAVGGAPPTPRSIGPTIGRPSELMTGLVTGLVTGLWTGLMAGLMTRRWCSEPPPQRVAGIESRIKPAGQGLVQILTKRCAVSGDRCYQSGRKFAVFGRVWRGAVRVVHVAGVSLQGSG